MSCHGCASSFGFLNKEYACPNCGFAYCSKCLKHKAHVPKLNKKSEVSVCRNCHKRLTEGSKVASIGEEYTPPAAFLSHPDPSSPIDMELRPNLPDTPSFIPQNQNEDGNGSFVKCLSIELRRLESLENPAKPPITVYQHNQRLTQLKTGLDQADKDIVERLERLKDERRQKPVPSEEEVARRLALLRGEDPDRKATAVSITPDTRSDEEKASSLLQQFEEEKDLDEKFPSPDEEIVSRLAKLRGLDRPPQDRKVLEHGNSKEDDDPSVSALLGEVSNQLKTKPKLEKPVEQELDECLKEIQPKLLKSKQKSEDSSSGDDSEVQKIVSKVFDEVSLEDDAFDDDDDVEVTNPKDDELPWCVICNEDASLRCPACDGDLYCTRCFSEQHANWERTDHKSVPFSNSST